jgi:hypothetical protein
MKIGFMKKRSLWLPSEMIFGVVCRYLSAAVRYICMRRVSTHGDKYTLYILSVYIWLSVCDCVVVTERAARAHDNHHQSGREGYFPIYIYIYTSP